MAIEIMAKVWRMPLSTNEKIVLLALSDHASAEGVCFPKLDTLCIYTGLGRRAVQDQISSLIASGHLTRNENPGRVNTFLVHPMGCAQPHPLGGAPRRMGGCAPAHGGDAPRRTGGCAPAHPIEPSSNHHKNHQLTTKVGDGPKVKAPKPQAEMPVGLNPVAWQRWIEYRKQIGRPLKELSLDAAAKKLARYSSDNQTKVVDQSIENGWQGLFELKVTASTKAASTEPARPRAKTVAELEAEELARGEPA
jgi:hypothetical protein